MSAGLCCIAAHRRERPGSTLPRRKSHIIIPGACARGVAKLASSRSVRSAGVAVHPFSHHGGGGRLEAVFNLAEASE